MPVINEKPFLVIFSNVVVHSLKVNIINSELFLKTFHYPMKIEYNILSNEICQIIDIKTSFGLNG